VGFLLILISIIIFVTLLGVDWQSLIAPVGTTALAISFVFGSAASSAFKSFIFLVFVNPYDIGDRITTSGMTVKVAKISLLSTTFFTPDGKKVIMPNAILADNTIVNHTRSRDVSLSIEFEVDAQTPSMKIALLKDSLAKWLKINRLDWDTDLGFWIAGINDRRSITISVWVTLLNTNWSQVGLWLDRRSDLLCFLKETLDGLEIKCYSNLTKIFGDKSRLLASERDSDDEDRIRRDLLDDDAVSDTHSRVSSFRKENLSPSSASDFVDAKRRNTRLLKQAIDAVKLVNPKSPIVGYTTPVKSSPAQAHAPSPDEVGSGIKERKKKKGAPKIEISPVAGDDKD
jgi:small-conductance mechanosensitive channel